MIPTPAAINVDIVSKSLPFQPPATINVETTGFLLRSSPLLIVEQSMAAGTQILRSPVSLFSQRNRTGSELPNKAENIDWRLVQF